MIHKFSFSKGMKNVLYFRNGIIYFILIKVAMSQMNLIIKIHLDKYTHQYSVALHT